MVSLSLSAVSSFIQRYDWSLEVQVKLAPWTWGLVVSAVAMCSITLSHNRFLDSHPQAIQLYVSKRVFCSELPARTWRAPPPLTVCVCVCVLYVCEWWSQGKGWDFCDAHTCRNVYSEVRVQAGYIQQRRQTYVQAHNPLSVLERKRERKQK